MHSQYSKVLLDLDVDFMLNNTCCEMDYQDLEIEISGTQYGKVVKRLLKPSTKIHLIVDHHEALFHWDQAKVRGALCIHIDAHHDMWDNPGICASEHDNRAELDCGCYLQQAMIDGVVNKTIYVPSPFRSISDERDDIECNFDYERGYRRVSIYSWNRFQSNIDQMPKADIVTIAMSPDFFPKRCWGEVEKLLEQLRIQPWTIKAIKSKAYSCWRRIDKEGAHDSFEFPYKGTVGLELIGTVEKDWRG